uniref:hypothetical protein n=1 Tax=Herbidospora sakaeratensis TaxID=564415 RepID=UPI000A797B77|nr:hypothetical protein [Herbidospora sakaeratensis]
MLLIVRRTAAGAAAGVLAFGLVLVATGLVPHLSPVTVYGLFTLVYAALPAGALLAWPLLWAFRVRPAGYAAVLGLLIVMVAGYLYLQVGDLEILPSALVVAGAYAVAALLTAPGLGWRLPLLAPDLADHTLEVVDVSPGFLHYRLVAATGPAVEVTIWPPGFGGLEGRIVERRDATVAIIAGPDVPESVIETIMSTLAPRPRLFRGDSVGEGR